MCGNEPTTNALRKAFFKLKKSFETCRKDLCDRLQVAKKEKLFLLVGGVDDDDDDTEILPGLSWKTALEAAATLEQYIGVLEESYARRLENLLMSFGRQTRFEETQNMVNTLFTDHFHKIHTN